MSRRSQVLLPLFIVLFAVVLVSALVVAMVEEAAHDRETRLHAAHKEAENLARAFEEHVIGSVYGIDAVLLHLRASWARHPDSFAEEAALHASFIAPEMLLHIGVIDARGMLRFSTLGPVREPVDLSDREHFRIQRDAAEDRLFIGKPLVGRLSGKPAIQFARRLTGRGGAFGGVIVASVDPGYFSRFYHSIDVGRHGAITLVGMDRVIRARASGVDTGENAIGRMLPPERPFFDLSQPAAGVYKVPSAIDGVVRIGAYRRVAGLPLVVLVLLAEEEVFTAVEARRLRLYGGAGLLAAVMLAGALAMAMLARREQRNTAALDAANRQLQANEEKLRRLAATDSLTGLPNRRAFEERGYHEMSRARRYHRPLALAVIDLDHFKAINDSFGHPAGDRLLQEMARACSACLRGADTLARVGGEEFALLLPETGAAEARRAAEKLRREVAGLRLELEEHTVSVTISIGVAVLSVSDASFDTLFSRADNALYEAKAAGRNRVVAAVSFAASGEGELTQERGDG